MYCAGNYRDHVTRFNHKDENRWMGYNEPCSRLDWLTILSYAIVGACVSGVVAIGLYLVQAA